MNPLSSTSGVWFPKWAEALAQARLRDFERQAYRLAIFEYLRFCKHSRQRASIDSARAFMQQVEDRRQVRVSQLSVWKSGLNWFFHSAKSPLLNPPMLATNQIPKPLTKGNVPPLAARDLGGPPWEQKLIRELRSRHYQWRTEQAYRMWAKRFADWLLKRSQTVISASEIDLRDFLSDLATHQRAAVATQRQALNAVVFLVRDALGRPLSDFSGFTRAQPIKRMPVVLSPQECLRLLQSLDGTQRLMAELMYGCGARLMELLRLRVKDVDLERRQLTIRAGKGGKDRVTVFQMCWWNDCSHIGSGYVTSMPRISRWGHRECGCRRAWSASIPRQANHGNGNGFFPPVSICVIPELVCSAVTMCWMERFKGSFRKPHSERL